MKILHTADWHIGKILHRHELNAEISLFFDWLEQTIISEKVDVLLISGDIFDLANPANKDLKQYYHFLHRLASLKIKTIITGGNHDSVSLLNAPSELLGVMNIHVVGGVPEDFEKQIIPISSSSGVIEAVVLAVPFLRDRDLRVSLSADLDTDRRDTIATAVKNHYDRLVQLALEKYGTEIPLIAMGHLFMQGSVTSDSEREIHVGTLQGIDDSIIHTRIDYMALGHIHKPQRISKQDHIRYSGSPVYLDFSEAGYEKIVVIVDFTKGQRFIQAIHIPLYRQLLRLKGSWSKIKESLHNYKNPYPLTTFVEIDVIEIEYNITVNYEVEAFKEETHSEYKIIKSKISVPGFSESNDVILDTLANTYTPLDMINKRIDVETVEQDVKLKLLSVYNEILESFAD
jgi:DNA repair protein SbcD/Mre11